MMRERTPGIWIVKVMLVLTMLIILFHFGEQHVNAAAINPVVHDDTTVRVYLTVSYDSEFLRAGDEADLTKRTGKVLARVPVDISYVDLAEYGLKEYYRYEANDFDDGGEYKNSTIVVQPTVLMLYLRATSLYYLEREVQASDIGDVETVYKDALTTSGGSTHLYFKRFWGHSENFMYFVNHEYPLQAEGWGATADYILLEDGDEIDVAMFSNTSFNQFGAFECFDETEYNVSPGTEITLRILASDTTESGKVLEPESGESIRVSSNYGETWQQTGAVTDSDGEVKVSFDEPGIYFVSAGPNFKRNVENEISCVAPPIAVVQVDPVQVKGGKLTRDDSSQDSYGTKCTWNGQGSNVSYKVDYRRTGDKTWATDTVTSPEYVVSGISPEECEVRVTPFIMSEYQPYEAAAKKISAKSLVIRYSGSSEDEGDPEGETEAERKAREEAERKAKVKAAKIKAAKAAKTTVKVKALKKHKAKVTWKKVSMSYTIDGKKFSTPVSGYKVYRATKKKGKYKLVKTIKKAGSLKYTDKKLKKGKKYYYKVRTYTKIDGKTYLGKWSKVKKIKAK